MQMVSMKLTDADKQADRSAMCGPCDVKEPDYPWGLRISLEEPSLAKLSLPALPQVGQELHMMAVVKVVEVGVREFDGKPKRNVDFMITDMSLMPKPAEQPAPSTSSVMFPSMAGEG